MRGVLPEIFFGKFHSGSPDISSCHGWKLIEELLLLSRFFHLPTFSIPKPICLLPRESAGKTLTEISADVRDLRCLCPVFHTLTPNVGVGTNPFLRHIVKIHRAILPAPYHCKILHIACGIKDATEITFIMVRILTINPIPESTNDTMQRVLQVDHAL